MDHYEDDNPSKRSIKTTLGGAAGLAGLIHVYSRFARNIVEETCSNSDLPYPFVEYLKEKLNTGTINFQTSEEIIQYFGNRYQFEIDPSANPLTFGDTVIAYMNEHAMMNVGHLCQTGLESLVAQITPHIAHGYFAQHPDLLDGIIQYTGTGVLAVAGIIGLHALTQYFVRKKQEKIDANRQSLYWEMVERDGNLAALRSQITNGHIPVPENQFIEGSIDYLTGDLLDENGNVIHTRVFEPSESNAIILDEYGNIIQE